MALQSEFNDYCLEVITIFVKRHVIFKDTETLSIRFRLYVGDYSSQIRQHRHSPRNSQKPKAGRLEISTVYCVCCKHHGCSTTMLSQIYMLAVWKKIYWIYLNPQKQPNCLAGSVTDIFCNFFIFLQPRVNTLLKGMKMLQSPTSNDPEDLNRSTFSICSHLCMPEPSLEILRQ